MRIKKYGIYHLSRKNSNSRYGHDIVVTGFDRKEKKIKYKNITSLENYNEKGPSYLKKNTVKYIKNGMVTALPEFVLKSRVWCGVYNDERSIDKDKIEEKKFVSQKEITGKYRKHLS